MSSKPEREQTEFMAGGIEWGHISLRQIFQTSAVEILNIADFFFSDTSFVFLDLTLGAWWAIVL